MKKNRITAIALFAILLLVACGGDYFYMFFEKSYILSYDKVKSYKAKKVADDWIFLGTRGTPYESWCFFLDEQTKEIYNKFSESHGDTAYNKTESLCVGSKDKEFRNSPMTPLEQTSMGMDIQSIIITSDADYDDNHPIGTPLNDIVRCVSYSLMEYIRQGYPEDFPTTFPKKEGEEVAGVPVEIENLLIPGFGYLNRQDKLLSEYTEEDFKLINRYSKRFPANSYDTKNELQPVALLQFTVLPTLAKDHNFKITITGTDMVKENLTFTTQCNMVFE